MGYFGFAEHEVRDLYIGARRGISETTEDAEQAALEVIRVRVVERLARVRIFFSVSRTEKNLKND